MAGNKNSGRAGRKGGPEEKYRLETIDESWVLLRENLNNEELDLEFRLDLAKALVVKSIPTELAGGFNAQITGMPTIQIFSGEATPNNLEFNIGSRLTDHLKHTGEVITDN